MNTHSFTGDDRDRDRGRENAYFVRDDVRKEYRDDVRKEYRDDDRESAHYPRGNARDDPLDRRRDRNPARCDVGFHRGEGEGATRGNEKSGFFRVDHDTKKRPAECAPHRGGLDSYDVFAARNKGDEPSRPRCTFSKKYKTTPLNHEKASIGTGVAGVTGARLCKRKRGGRGRFLWRRGAKKNAAEKETHRDAAVQCELLRSPSVSDEVSDEVSDGAGGSRSRSGSRSTSRSRTRSRASSTTQRFDESPLYSMKKILQTTPQQSESGCGNGKDKKEEESTFSFHSTGDGEPENPHDPPAVESEYPPAAESEDEDYCYIK